METEKATPELLTALSKAQGEIENASKNASNPHFRSKYADLAEVLNTIRPTFSKHGLSILQSPEFDGSLVSVVTMVAHSSGGIITCRASCYPAKTDAQGIGSATTYLRRYSAAAIAGIAQEDDDGNSAAHNGRPNQTPAQKVSPTTGAWESLSEEAQAYLQDHADHIIDLGVDRIADVTKYLGGIGLDSEEKIALWTRFDSKLRAAIKTQTAKDKNNE